MPPEASTQREEGSTLSQAPEVSIVPAVNKPQIVSLEQPGERPVLLDTSPTVAKKDEAASGGLPSDRSSKRRKILKKLALAGILLAVGFISFTLLRGFGVFDPFPPTPDVVATYEGGEITVGELQEHVTTLIADEKLRARLQDFSGYQLIVEEILTDKLVGSWAAKRNVEQDDSIQHTMKHLDEEINLDDLHAKLHKDQMGVSESDISAYFQANREEFREKTIDEVREEIRATLQAQNEDTFVADYLKNLAQKASITRNFELLAVPEPTEPEILFYYQANAANYRIKAYSVVDEMSIPVSGDETTASEQANNFLNRIRSGEDFAQVAKDAPSASQDIQVAKGSRDAGYDEAVGKLDPGQVSDVFKANNLFYIVKLKSKASERQQSVEEVHPQIKALLLRKGEEKWFAENANRTLFTLYGKGYTIGEFWKEYQELPTTFLTDFVGPEGKQQLAERLVNRLLLVKDSFDQLLSSDNKEESKELKLKVLAQMMEQEGVDDKVTITEEESKKFYEEHKSELQRPAQSKIRQVVIKLGEAEDEQKRARDKAQEAYKKLDSGFLKKSAADFAQVARDYSEDEATREKGGEVAGWVGEEVDFFSELQSHGIHEQITRLPEGAVSPPFESNGFIYIIEVLDRSDPAQLTYEETKDLIEYELRQRKHEELSQKFSQALLKQSKVVIYNRVLRRLANEGENASPND